MAKKALKQQATDVSVDEDEASVEGHAAINFRPLEPGPGTKATREPIARKPTVRDPRVS